jgi:hypothetical protein
MKALLILLLMAAPALAEDKVKAIIGDCDSTCMQAKLDALGQRYLDIMNDLHPRPECYAPPTWNERAYCLSKEHRR